MKKQFILPSSQSGRSMVEMLGILAIIGVLSIGGIASYSYGMDKYRANQTVNDVMLRAVDVMTQLSQGREPNLEPEWGKKGTVYDMIEIQDETNKTWGIVVDGVPSRVCQMVGDALKNQATVYVGNAERNDTTDNDPCESSDENTMKFYFEPIEKILTCEPECPSGEFCQWGECVSEKIEVSKWPTDSACTTNTDCEPCGWCGWNASCIPYNGKDCTINTSNDGMCYWGECLPKGCNDKNPCTGQGKYCASPGTYSDSTCTPFQENETGTCVKADFKPHIINGTEYYISNTRMNWWDAEAGCRAMGRDGLIDINDLIDEWNGIKWKDYPVKITAQQLYNIIGENQRFWTNFSSNSCEAYAVANNGYVTLTNPVSELYMAVCK